MDLILWLIIGVIIIILIVTSVIGAWAAVRYTNSSSATGSVNAELIKDPANGDRLSLFYDINATNLTSPITSAQFRLGKSNANGPILKSVILKQYVENNKNVYKANGIWDLTIENTGEAGQPNMDHAQILNALRNDNIYFSINTQRHPTGELKTQLTKFKI